MRSVGGRHRKCIRKLGEPIEPSAVPHCTKAQFPDASFDSYAPPMPSCSQTPRIPTRSGYLIRRGENTCSTSSCFSDSWCCAPTSPTNAFAIGCDAARAFLCNSYVRHAPQPSISYAARVHFPPAMRMPIHFLGHSADAHDRAPPAAGGLPAPGEVLAEIGLLLAIHLTVALTVTVTLRWCGYT